MGKIALTQIPLYLIVRPSGLPFLDEIKTFVSEGGFDHIWETQIPDWSNLAQAFYFDKFGDRETGKLQPGAQAWIMSTNVLFGNQAKLLVLEAKAILENVGDLGAREELVKIKRCYRAKKKALREALTITCRHVGIDYTVFFDYIHCPDPDQSQLEYEWNWLSDNGLIEKM